jgi:hypothetical protein
MLPGKGRQKEACADDDAQGQCSDVFFSDLHAGPSNGIPTARDYADTITNRFPDKAYQTAGYDKVTILSHEPGIEKDTIGKGQRRAHEPGKAAHDGNEEKVQQSGGKNDDNPDGHPGRDLNHAKEGKQADAHGDADVPITHL